MGVGWGEGVERKVVGVGARGREKGKDLITEYICIRVMWLQIKADKQ